MFTAFPFRSPVNEEQAYDFLLCVLVSNISV
jgi:hypothetical protein